MPSVDKPHSAISALPGASRAPLPDFLSPQLATLVADPPAGDHWLHELKFDGYRILARLDHGTVRLLSRNGRDWTSRLPGPAGAVRGVPASRAMLDGEVAVFMPDGTTSFQALQNMFSGVETGGSMAYVVFDLLHLDGQDLTGVPLEQRKAALARILAGPPAGLRYSEHVVGGGRAFFARACEVGLEGIICKRRDAPYRGTRSADWLKVKCAREQEVVIGGYTDPEGSRVGIGALLAGVYEGTDLAYIGKIGTGFTSRTLHDLKARLARLARPTSPFSIATPRGTGIHWVKPQLVAQVKFTEWTSDGKLRHPSFQGLRADKAPADVVRERPSKR